MRYLKFIFIFLNTITFAQNNVETLFIDKVNLHDVLGLHDDESLRIDNFKNIYIISENSILKKTDKSEFIYNNIMLGQIESFDIFNPLKINIFYKDFNSVIILDNRLAEIEKINFNLKRPFKNVSHISTGNDNTIWCFNQNTQELELFNYRTNTTQSKTLPINENVIALNSNYNMCWLLTEKYLYVYNYFGSLLNKIKNVGFIDLRESNGNIVLKKENSLYYFKKNTETPALIELPNLLIKQFFVTNESLYIYDGENLHQYQLKNQ